MDRDGVVSTGVKTTQKIKRNLINVIDNPRHTFGTTDAFYHIHVCLEADAVSTEDLNNILKCVGHGSFEATMLNLIDIVKDNLTSFKLKCIFDNVYGFEIISNVENNYFTFILNVEKANDKETIITKLDRNDYIWGLIDLLSSVKNNLRSTVKDIDTVLERLLRLVLNSLTDDEPELTIYNLKICKEE